MALKQTIPTTGSDSLQFGNATTPVAAQVSGYEDSTGNGHLELYTTASGVVTERVRIDKDGNVGIGVNAPVTVLHIQGATITDGSLSYNQQVTATTAYNASPMTGTLVSLKYNSGGSYAGMGGWSIAKENATDGNFASYMAFHTRQNGGATTERMRIDSSGNLLFNSGYGSVATAYGCRAWVNFAGTSSGTITPRASGNVTSVTKNGSGDYTLNFTNAMPDANYCFTGTAKPTTAMGTESYGRVVSVKYNVSPTTSALRVTTCTTGVGLEDFDVVCIAIFR